MYGILKNIGNSSLIQKYLNFTFYTYNLVYQFMLENFRYRYIKYQIFFTMYVTILTEKYLSYARNEQNYSSSKIDLRITEKYKVSLITKVIAHYFNICAWSSDRSNERNKKKSNYVFPEFFQKVKKLNFVERKCDFFLKGLTTS